MINSVSYSTFNIGRFRGVDYADSELNMNVSHSPDMMNLIPYENGAVRSRNGYENVLSCDGRINGIYSLVEQKGTKVLIHHGNKLSEWRMAGIANSLYGYTAPAEGLAVRYVAYLSDGTYGFEHTALTEENVVTFNDGSFYVDGVKQATTPGGNSSPILMEITKYGAEISRADFGDETSAFVEIDLSYTVVGSSGYATNKAQSICTLGRVDKTEVAEDGSDIVYDVSTYNKSNKTGTMVIGSKSFTANVYPYPSHQRANPYKYIRIGFANPNEAVLSSDFDYKVTYSFRVGKKAVAKCRIAALQADDFVVYDEETKKLYINNAEVAVDNGLSGGQVIDLENLGNGAASVLNDIDVILPDRKGACVQMGNKLYIFSGEMAYVYGEFDVFDELGNKTGTRYELRKMEDEAYVPTILINSEPIKTKYQTGSRTAVPVDTDGGGGVKYEDINLISAKSTVGFLVSQASAAEALPILGENKGYSGTAGDYYHKLPLPQRPIQSVEKVEKLNPDGDWEEVLASTYTVDTDSGILTFNAPLSVTSVSGKDNYRVTYSVDWRGEAEERSLIKQVEESNFLLENFNPPIILKYSRADNYKKHLDGIYYSATKYRILLGTDLADNGAVRIRLTGKRLQFENKENKRIRLGCIDLKAGYTAQEQKIPIPGTNDYAVRVLDSNEYSCDSSEYVYVRIYTQVVKDGENYYLDITQPYTICLRRDEDGDLSIIRIGEDCFTNIKLTYSQRSSSYPDRVNKAAIVTKFGASGNMDRLFVAGWDKMREYEFWSEVDNPLYFPDLNYACLGDEDTAIMGWSRINNNQMAIHKNSNGSDPTVYIQSASLSQNTVQVENAKSGTLQLLSTFSVTFPVTEGPAGDGVISPRAFGVLCGEPLALSEKGVFATKYVADIAADVRYAVPRSYYINPKLKECDLSDAEAIVFNNRYYLSLGDGRVFVADGAQRYAVGGDSDESSFEWFPWDNVPARIWWVSDDRLYFGTADGRICRFTDGFMDIDKPVKAYWTSPWLDFGTQTYYKKIKNVVLTCTEPRTDFSEVNIDYIGKNGAKTVKSYLIDNTSHLGVIPSIATNRKAKKVTGLKVRVRSDNAEDFGIMALSFLYIISGKFKG